VIYLVDSVVVIFEILKLPRVAVCRISGAVFIYIVISSSTAASGKANRQALCQKAVARRHGLRDSQDYEKTTVTRGGSTISTLGGSEWGQLPEKLSVIGSNVQFLT